MKVNKLIIGLSLVLSMSIISCEDEVLPDEFTHKYEQTQCADPWGNDRNANDLEAAIINYLKDQFITVIVEAKENTGDLQVCNACSCTTGTTIFVKASAEDGQKLIALDERWEVL